MERSRELVNELLERACVVGQADDGLRIFCKSDGGYAVTPEKYKVPVVVDAMVKTDSTNIRLRFREGAVILNWENNKDELRWHDPISGKEVGVRGKGRVPENEWIRIVWRIDESSASLIVDGEERCRFEGDYRDAAGQIGIGSEDPDGIITHVSWRTPDEVSGCSHAYPEDREFLIDYMTSKRQTER
ncbi:hypothetical protein PV433_07465 [Paenibacillus sp. GYB004]|uniref:hypothetical protein n=1 Tax=Paenibacillus sp. GYB004 TaxID=2994393 RepID=UPI002F9680C8